MHRSKRCSPLPRSSTPALPLSPPPSKPTTLVSASGPRGSFPPPVAFRPPDRVGTLPAPPTHFSWTGRTVDQVPLRQLIAPALVPAVPKKAEAEADSRLSA